MRVVYVTGPGNVKGTYRHFVEDRRDPGQISVTYSDQFFQLCRDRDLEALALTSHPEKGRLTDGRMTIDSLYTPWTYRGGVRFRLAWLWYNLKMMAATLAFRADVAVVSESVYWFMLAPLRLFGVKVIPTIHCVLWPASRPRTSRQRVFWALNGWWFRHCASAVMCVSEEIARQVRELLRGVPMPVHTFIPTYLPGTFATEPGDTAAKGKDRVILFVGRVEAAKGAFDLVTIAEDLVRRGREDFCIEVCGDGAALEGLKSMVAEAGLQDRFRIRGPLNRQELAPSFRDAYAVIVPTRTEFVEGFNKVVAEGILSEKPVITSPVCPAVEYFGEGIVVVPPDDPRGYADAIERLLSDPEYRRKVIEAAEPYREQFFDWSRGWAATLDNLLTILFPDGHPRPTREPAEQATGAGSPHPG